jgi:hypothetical protein
MKAAAREAVVVSEPVENVSAHSSWLGRIAGGLSNPGVGEYRERFDLAALRTLAAANGPAELFHGDGDRNAVLVFPVAGADARAAV